MLEPLIAARFSQMKKCGIVTTIVLFFLLLLFTSILLVADQLTGNGFDESVFFHLSYGLGGAGIWDFLQVILLAIGLIFLSLLLSFFLYRLLLRNYIKFKYGKALGGVSIVLLFLSLGFHPLTGDLIFLFSASRSQEFSKFYKPLRLKDSSVDPPNIVYIYLESVERTYLDETIFPGLTKEIKQLESSALSFTNIDDGWGMGWTIAGMTASQCAIPLVTTGSSGNSMSGMSEFYPNAVCLGDILQNQGFNLSYMGGASLDFAGKGKFYSTHGFERVRGLDELRSTLKDPNYTNSWGLYDDTVFEQAWDEFLSLSYKNKPFGLFMLTMDTHHPKGHLSESCGNVSYQEKNNSMLDSVACTDYLVGEFIHKIMDSEYSENTLIVLASDHLALPNRASSMLQEGVRKNLFMVMRKGQIQGRMISKVGTSLDIAPTLLGLLGYGDLSFGLGRNLLGDTPTLREEVDNLNPFLRSLSADLLKFWHFPTLGEKIRINSEKNYVEIEGEQIALPVLFSLSEKKGLLASQKINIKKIYFPANTRSQSQLNNRLSSFKKDDLFVWIDRCSSIKALVPEYSNSENYCLVGGKLGLKEFFHNEIIKEEKIDVSEIEEFSNNAYFPSVFKKHKRALRAGSIENNWELSLPSGTVAKDYYLNSYGGPGVESLIMEGEKVVHKNNRGFNVFGISDDDGISFLYNIDLCLDPGLINNSLSVAELIAKNKTQYQQFVVVVHDSAFCGNAEYFPFFADLDAGKWVNIDSREPYIALLDMNKKFIAEYSGNRESSIQVHLKSYNSQ